ncbi:hypothetical protein [Oceanobacillus bengalensis]|uniref:J domain-containing protein n=1 Tax=Oceanobacillus bengalensis TaxID=1435466 RepID=A0A494YSX1_9BACI|nr:hypothetical protein [Oceanobacillus bengalensis]RKQ13207.1 hypothetical protein D8M05_17060 [Oceanobacillus bengalensis]
MDNYYDLLELNVDASESEIKEKIKAELSKWRKRVNAPDPQRQRIALERMELLQKAEEILLDPANKEEYNRALQQSINQADHEENINQQLSLADQLIGEAHQLIEQNNIADAIVLAKKATETDGNHPYTWSSLARAHFLWGEIQDATYEIKRAISLLPNEPHFYYVLYRCHMERQDLQFHEKLNLAEEAISKALNIAPDNPDYIIETASIARQRGQIDHGINLLKQLEGRHGLAPNAQNILAELYYDKGLSMTQKVNYNNGESLYYFIDKQATLQGKDHFIEASKYVHDNHLRQEIQKWIGLANSALKTKNNFKVLALFIIIIPIFLSALEDFNVIMMLFMAGAGYLAWKKGRVPQYELNRKYINTLS